MPIVKFAHLTSDVPDSISEGSHARFLWNCDCGRQTQREYRDVAKGKSRNCGRCNWLTEYDMSTRTFGSLRAKFPQEIAPKSGKRLVWICSCGRETEASVQDVTCGHKKSCGRCGLYGRVAAISAEKLLIRKFGGLRMKHPETVNPGSHRKIVWVCDCGREKAIDINSVILGKSKSCGHCRDIPAAEAMTRKFGRLRLKTAKDLPPGSAKKVAWVCDCGEEATVTINHVVSGHTKSCGRCLLSYNRHHRMKAAKDILHLRTPIQPEQLPDWCPVALEPILRVSTPFKAQCRLCGREYSPRWDGIRLGKSLTCGCTTSRVSTGVQELHDFIRSIGLEVVLEHTVGNMKYDMFVPSHNLAIEFAGLRWHSFPDSLRRDLAKRRQALDRGLQHCMIFEDEWMFNRPKIKNFFKNLLHLSGSKSVRPSKCKFVRIEAKQADPFYEKHHYIGACRAKVNYGVFLDDALIACCSFKKPTRQSKHDWELVRMASSPKLRVHGAWSKILKQFISEFKPMSIVSFSDNRLFDGKVYGKIGFRFDGDVKPTRYWWKNKRRHHQSSLRKPKGEVRTETELRKSQGYGEIWDLGKRRWVWSR